MIHHSSHDGSHAHLQEAGEGEEAMGNTEWKVGPILEVIYITSAHIPLARVQSCGQTYCRGGWDV